MTTFTDAAIECRARGWSVIPIVHRPGKAKRPAIQSWKPYAAVAATPATLRTWFNRNGVDGLAVILGDVSHGLTCRDFDDAVAYQRWADGHSELAATLATVETRRGYHVYCHSNVRKTTEFSDGELRAGGGAYVLLPPSRHPDGGVYRWLIPPTADHLPTIDPAACGLLQSWSDSPAAFVPCALGQRDRETETRRIGETEETEAISALPFAFLETLPRREGERNRRIFDLARTLKGMPAYADANLTDLRPLVKAWHRAALPVIGTKLFDDTWADFAHGWQRVRFPKGAEPMTAILKSADAAELPALAMRYECPMTHRLIRLCRELQRTAGERAFFLSCRTAGSLLAVDHRTAWMRLRMLEADGVLRPVQRGTKQRATRYRYIANDDGGTIDLQSPGALGGNLRNHNAGYGQGSCDAVE